MILHSFEIIFEFLAMSREERLQRDLEQNPQRQRSEETAPAAKDISRAINEEDTSLRPGEKGWIARARVPLPSNKDYVNRPRWKVDTDISRVCLLFGFNGVYI